MHANHTLYRPCRYWILISCIWIAFELNSRITSGQQNAGDPYFAILTANQCSFPNAVAINPSTGVIFAACEQSGIISIRGSVLTLLATATECPAAKDVLFHPTDQQVVYAACYEGGIISINGSLVTTLASALRCKYPSGLAFNPSSGMLFATCFDADSLAGPSVISINSSSHAVTTLANSSQCSGPNDVTVNPSTGILYVACFGDSVISIDGNVVTRLANSTECISPNAVSFDSSDGTLYAACSLSGIISVTGAVVTSLANSTQCPGAKDVVIHPADGVVYGLCNQGGIISISNSIVTTLATPTQCPSGQKLSFNPSNGVLFAACHNGGVISIDGGVVTTVAFSGCNFPLDIAINPLNGIVYVACAQGGVLSISGSVVTTLATSAQCPSATRLSIDPSNGMVYAACRSKTVISTDGTVVTSLATSIDCHAPTDVLFHPSNGLVYAACSNGIISINGSVVTTLASSTQCPTASRLYINPSNGILYCTCLGGSVITMNGSVVTELTSSTQCGEPKELAFNPSSGIVYASCSTTSNVVSIAGSVVTSLTASILCAEPSALAFNPSNGVLYVACYAGGIASINGSVAQMVVNVTQCPSTNDISFNPSTGVVYAVCQQGKVISLSDSGVKELTTAAQCDLPSWVAYNPLNSLVYVACKVDMISINAEYNCAAGVYFNSSDDSCEACSAGTYRDDSVVHANQNRFSCETCGLGQYCTATASIPCAAGTYNPSPGATNASQCIACTVGFVSSAMGAISADTCIECGVGTYSFVAGATQCQNCATDTFWERPFDTAPGLCIACTSLGCQGTDQCVLGYLNSQCTSCAPNYFARTLDRDELECVQCESTPAWLIVIICLVVVFLAAGFVKLSSSRLYLSCVIPLRIGATFMNLISFMQLLQLQWPSSTRSALSVMSALTLNLHLAQNSICLISFSTQFWFILALPLLIGTVFLTMRLVLPRCQPCLTSKFKSLAYTPEQLTLLLLQSFISFLSFAYQFLSWQSVVIFDCFPSSDGDNRVRDSVNIACGSTEWRQYVAVSVCAIIMYVIGIPVLLIYVAYRDNGDIEAREGQIVKTTDLEYRHHLYTEAGDFKPACRWWGIFQLVWKLLVVLTLRLLTSFVVTQVCLFSCLLVIRVLITSIFRPYKKAAFNNLELLLSASTVVILFCGCLFYGLENHGMNSTGQSILFSVCVVALASIPIVLLYFVRNDYKQQASQSQKQMELNESDSASIDAEAAAAAAAAEAVQSISVVLPDPQVESSSFNSAQLDQDQSIELSSPQPVILPMRKFSDSHVVAAAAASVETDRDAIIRSDLPSDLPY